ncbi:MAG: hypothetical protein AB9869_05680 [Verrucomicrobiia bacterium]
MYPTDTTLTSVRLVPNGTGDILLGSFTYQSGVLGGFYHGQTNLGLKGGGVSPEWRLD